jgi:uncharacterized protein (UPF0332 family)
VGFPQELLEQAQHLANREPTRPRQASLRRSLSAAYYALFHLLTTETAKNWKRPNERPIIARMMNHGDMNKICIKKREELRRTSRPGDHLLTITSAFVQLQQDRHAADYDDSIEWERSDVLDRVTMVKHAFASWRAIRNQPEAQQFLASLLLKPR